MKALSPKFWSRRCDRLFDAADRLKEEVEATPSNHGFWRGESKTNDEALAVLRKFQKMNLLYEQAALISMLLNTLEEYGNDEVKEFLRKERENAAK